MTQAPLHPFLDHPRPVAIAHRGGSLEAEENTLPAFEHAMRLGFTHVELDVHLTRDGEVVVHHDPTLERIFGVPRPLAELTLADLATIRSPGGATVPTLAKVLGAFPDLNVAIEIKAPAVARPLAALIRKAGVIERVCVGSFDPAATRTIRAALGSALCWSPAHLGVARLVANSWGANLACPFPVVQIPTQWRGIPVVTRRLIRAARDRGIQVQVWTVDEATEMTRLLDLGVDAIMTDRPSLLRKVLQDRGEWHGR